MPDYIVPQQLSLPKLLVSNSSVINSYLSSLLIACCLCFGVWFIFIKSFLLLFSSSFYWCLSKFLSIMLGYFLLCFVMKILRNSLLLSIALALSHEYSTAIII